MRSSNVVTYISNKRQHIAFVVIGEFRIVYSDGGLMSC